MIRIPRTITLLLLAALAIRLICVAIFAPPVSTLNQLPDQVEYLLLGQNLLHSGTMSFVDPRFDQRVYAYRSPGYPLLVAACGGSVDAIRAVQAVLDTSTVLAAYLLAWRLTGRRGVAAIAGALVAINPLLIYFCGLVLTETLFVALLSWGVCLLAWGWLAVAAAVLAAAAAVRPEAIVLGPLLAMVAAGVAAARGRARAAGSANPPVPLTYHSKRTLRDGVVVAAAVVIVLFPWGWRNHRVLGAWIWTTTNGGVTLYDGFNPGATGASDQRFLAAMPQLRPITEVDRSATLQRLAIGWAMDHPGRAVGLAGAKIARTWSPVPLSRDFGRPAYRLVAAGYAVPLDLLAILGLLRRGTLGGRAKLLLCTTAIGLTLMHALTVGSLRYRLAAEPMLAVLAASGVARRVNGP